MRQQMKESITAERANRQRHQEGEQELEAGLLEDGDENHADKREQADDGDGDEARDPDPHCTEGEWEPLGEGQEMI